MLFPNTDNNLYFENWDSTGLIHPDIGGLTPLDADKYIAMSLLQKAIRRGEFGYAYTSALNLMNLNARAFWRRLMIIAFEDIGVANIDLIGRVTTVAGDKRLRQSLGDDRQVAATLIYEMCTSAKDRSTDDILEYVERAPVMTNLMADLAEADMSERLTCATDCASPLSHRAAAALAAAIGLPSDMAVHGEKIACANGYFDALTEAGFDPLCVELSRLGLRRSGVSLPVFLPLLDRGLKSEQVTEQDDAFPPETLISGIPSWTYNGHTRVGLAAFRAYGQRSAAMRDFLAEYANGELSKSKTVGALVFPLESGQMTRRLHWPTGDRIRSAIEKLGWGIPDHAVSIGAQILLEDFDLLNECRVEAARLYLG